MRPDLQPLTSLVAGSMYKFRVLAVFSNNDNKQSPNSRKFTLKMAPAHMPQAPAAGPVIVEARPVSPSAISITWQVRRYLVVVTF